MKTAWAFIPLVSALVAGSALAQGGPSDPQIAGIVVTANQIDIDAGKLAKARSKNKEVQAFADQMVTDHTAVNKQASALASKLKVKPEDSDTSKSLKQGAQKNMANLKKLNGAAFDKAYIDHEVAYHQAVLDAIDIDHEAGRRGHGFAQVLSDLRRHRRTLQAPVDRLSRRRPKVDETVERTSDQNGPPGCHRTGLPERLTSLRKPCAAVTGGLLRRGGAAGGSVGLGPEARAYCVCAAR